MLYLNTKHINDIGVDWPKLIGVIEEAVYSLKKRDFAQPVKPYLKYGNPKNRIIAMPAYVGGSKPMAGIKWIASFPENILNGKLRASSVTILNEYNTGIPLCVINTTLISAIRTASVSGLIISEYLKLSAGPRKYKIGIIGFGPIGRMHLKMVEALVGTEKIERIFLYDINKIDVSQIDSSVNDRLHVCDSWESAYVSSDIVITCTVSESPYINKKPLSGSLHLNVSLRDYMTNTRHFMDKIIVDDWEEVCRQNTDIEKMYIEGFLKKDEVIDIVSLICDKLFLTFNNSTIMFNPMGMAVFDIAIGSFFYNRAVKEDVGLILEE